MNEVPLEATPSTETKPSVRRLRRRPRRLLLLSDVLIGLLSTALAYAIMVLRGTPGTREVLAAVLFALVTVVITIGLLSWSGHYSKQQRLSRLTDTGFFTRDLIIAAAVTNLASFVTRGFFTDVIGLSRLAIGSFILLFWLLGLAARFLVTSHQRRLFRHGVGVRKIMVLGTGPEADEFMEFVQARPWLGMAVAGRLILADQDDPTSELDVDTGTSAASSPCNDQLPLRHLKPSLKGLEHLDQTMRELAADEVIVALGPQDSGRLPEITSFLSLVRVPFKIVPSLFEETAVAAQQGDLTPVSVLDLAVDPPDRLVRFVKRTMDVSVSLVALLLLIPFGLPIVLAIAIESGRPVFYKQERLGMYGRPFFIHKFRTMVVDAEARLAQLKDKDEGEGPHFKMVQDPRLTKVGAFLRKWSLDELPQFWTVLRGDMSVVGPRPPLAREVAQYQASQLVRLKGKPGITGLWQVSGRKNLTFDDMVRLDRYYLENWSLRLDLSIIMRTFAAVLTRRGAY